MANVDPSGAPAAVSLAGGDIDLRSFLRLLSRRRWIILGVTALGLAGAAVMTVRAPRIYRAATRVVIDKTAPRVLNDDVREVYNLGAATYWASQEYFATQHEMIRSEPIARRVVNMLGIHGPTLAQEVRQQRGAASDVTALPQALRDKVALTTAADEPNLDALIATLEGFDAVSFVRGRITVEPLPQTQLVDIVVHDTVPVRAASIANTVTEAYMELNLEQRVEFSSSAIDWLDDQVLELKEKLHQSELLLHDFKEQNNIVSVSLEDRQSILSQSFTSLTDSLTDVQALGLGQASRLDEMRRAKREGIDPTAFVALLANDVIPGLRLVQSELNRELAELTMRYTDDHPKLQATRSRLAQVERDLEKEIDNSLHNAEEEHRASVETERRLRLAIEELKREALDLNRKEIDYKRLKRESDNNNEVYSLVLKRQKEVNLTRMLKANNVRVLEQAKPPGAPVSPRPRINLMAGLALGLILGLGIAFLVDYLDSSVKSQEMVEQQLGLAFLGILPSIKSPNKTVELEPGSRDRHILDNPRSSVAECARTIRTNLMFMSPDDPARTVLVTSSGPREGKSTLVVNLAISMAQSGLSTLVVDTDMRRPRLHRSFGVPGDVGMSTAILGNVRIEEATRPSGIPNLDVLPCGPIPPNPAELLHTETFQNVFAALEKRYDRVIFDSPPVGAVSDALILGSMVDGIVLVIEAGSTSWQAARQAKRRIVDVGGHLYGAVLNNVDLDSTRSTYYYQYYYYRAGYTEEDKPEKRASA